jgi:DNA-binding NtrC family response regulator
VRLITATHQDLKKLIASGRFREDLYYRLNVISIALPTLTEREEDIYELSLHFLKRTAARLGKSVTQVSDEALESLKRYSWPGNIRELENVLERAVVLAEGDVITVRDLPRELLEGTRPPGGFRTGPSAGREATRMPLMETEPSSMSGSEKLGRLSELAEREEIESAIHSACGNKAEAARLLGIPRSTLFSKMRKYRINKPR